MAADDAGLRYLDWLLGQDWCNPVARAHVAGYLADEAVQRELQMALDDYGWIPGDGGNVE